LDIGFHEKAANMMLSREIVRPLHDYRKKDGQLTSAAKKSTVQQSMFAHIDSEQEKLNGDFTNEQRKALPTLSKLANKRSQYLQKKQILNLARNALRLNFTNAITYEPLDPKNAYILPENYRMGSKQMYSLNTLEKLQNGKGNGGNLDDEELREIVIQVQTHMRQSANRTGIALGSLNNITINYVRKLLQMPRGIVSPYTRRPIEQALPFKTQYNLKNRKVGGKLGGKFNLLNKYLKDPHKTTENIAKLYNLRQK
jgi:hypothetical protein